MDYRYQFEKCGKCGREMLVEQILFGTNHTASIIVNWKDCLKKAPLPKDFMEQHPEDAKAIL